MPYRMVYLARPYYSHGSLQGVCSIFRACDVAALDSIDLVASHVPLFGSEFDNSSALSPPIDTVCRDDRCVLELLS